MRKKINIKIFLERANKIHKNKYSYEFFNNEINSKTKIKIICPEHGEFFQTVNNHLNMKQQCPKCANKIRNINNKSNNENFIKKANDIHNNFYSYKKTVYVSAHENVIITCPEHGDFKQSPHSHLKGHGCRKCANKKIRLKTIERLNNNLKNKFQIKPNFNPKACEIFDEIMKKNNVYIQHAMNDGEFYIKELGYFVDGYDKENNIIYEFDEKYHYSKKQQEKDRIREKEIIKLLKCKFVRIKE